ncbi:helix-turn-helix domain-containing protein [Aneurinibacillus thermoaerophilus]|uniref:helix-turn-helix domain-containing protein n=1 Tax=Aneurinibacillus thermoaerophilus TaxID=143495 RepID=UPI002E215E1F|nr:helix-turn-helix domain-containing protein [Aneurinibacillus thermoaerophilus]
MSGVFYRIIGCSRFVFNHFLALWNDALADVSWSEFRRMLDTKWNGTDVQSTVVGVFNF